VSGSKASVTGGALVAVAPLDPPSSPQADSSDESVGTAAAEIPARAMNCRLDIAPRMRAKGYVTAVAYRSPMSAPTAVRPAMKEYGVPDDLEGVLPWSWAEERLLASRNLWVVTASADGRPHAMPVWGVWLPAPSTFLFSCAPSSRKARNLRENPRVTVAVDHTVEVVTVEGSARLVDPADASDGIDAYLRKYYEDESTWPGAREFLAQNLIFEVAPDRAFGIIEDEVDFSQRATKWVW
jgi:PPOX class probable F420-dependent enzyme